MSPPTLRGTRRPRTLARTMVLSLVLVGLAPLGIAHRTVAAAVDHLVISEVVTGGASATDELIELYNPSVAVLPLEGLELVYVSASGATISLRAAWSLGVPGVPPGAHVLVANESGIYAAIADAVYVSGMAATGGSDALRI
ncbi:MAG: lamin tail domain-containing protein, partial [Candidatus Limnocylindria bacterium]